MPHSHSPVPPTDASVEATPELTTPRQRRKARPWEEPVTPPEESVATPPDTVEVDRVPRRWDRLARLVGESGVRRLMESHVLVVGLGGVGSYVAEALTRSAVGQLTLVDFDDICVTNVNRQLQAFPATVGQSKVHVLASRIKAINPDVRLKPAQAFFDHASSAELLTPRPDFVVDAIDNVTAKLHLLATCYAQEIAITSVTGAGARLDPTQVRVADLTETRVDPLARILRRELSRQGLPTDRPLGIPVVYSEEPVRDPIPPSWDEAEGFQCICPHGEDSPHACEKRRVIYGTAAFMTAAFGMAAASVAVRHLTGTNTRAAI